jgi:hypothetical protein
MPIIRLQLAPISAKIIAHEYHPNADNGTIQLTDNDLLLHFLTLSPNTNQSDFKRLTATLDFDVPANKAKYINSKTVGNSLKRLHILTMCRDVAQSLNLNSNIKSDLQNWLRNRGVEEDDFALETALKLFLRFRQKNMSNCCKVSKIFVPSDCNNSTSQSECEGPLSIEAAELAIEQFKQQNAPYFQTKRGQPLKKLLKQFRLWVWVRIVNMPIGKIEKNYKIPSRTTYHAVRRFQHFLDNTKNLTAFSTR